jgi:hypothetical protein
MVGGARWILIGTAMMLIAGALSWSCGGGSSNSTCTTTPNGIPIGNCGTPSPPGPALQSISICPGSPPTPTPEPSSTASTSPTPMETMCPAPLPTTKAVQGATVQFHAVGTFSDMSTQDLTGGSTVWTSTNTDVVMPNSTPAGSFFATGPGSAVINATSGGISGPGAGVAISSAPTATPTPAGPAAADSDWPPGTDLPRTSQ